ncbi:Immunoglobulin domain-containing protein [Sulfidibacter corallicola]|uniref:Immunoglobulin domain-containing protein n=1 Tax=Sulfidibacter corallicola TaxID=2818388 RepID=A0A8A4TK19_SULCO|nr:immunoglobulin domain-containing protein [Sulfidibacter corallicola]QTD49168.1 immunoglobulin domain-containing protein [Sulfidibacter corallicola]
MARFGMRGWIFLWAVFQAATCLWAASPAAPIEVTLKQPDGTAFVARSRGNYYVSWMETLDGHTIVKEKDTWYYAEKALDGSLRATRSVVGSLPATELSRLPRHLRPAPTEREEPWAVVRRGATTQPILVLLVSFSNRSFTYSVSDFESAIFGATGSVKEFFLENSYNNFTVTPASETQGTSNDGMISVTLGYNHPNPGQTTSTSRTIAIDAVTAANSFIDYSSFDTDADGAVSASELSIVLILAGYENSFGGASSPTPRVWGHKSSFSTTTLDSVDLSPYTMFGEIHEVGATSRRATIGIMCHELGHLMFGLPDLYDITGGSEGIGDWGLMGSGSWNQTGGASGDTPAHLMAWCKEQVDFLTPTVVTSSQTSVSLNSLEGSADARRINLDPYKVREYFLIAARHRTDYDGGLPGDGVMVWHIDPSQTTNADENRKLVDLEEADGLAELDSETDQGDTGDPYPGSTNNTTFNDSSNPNSKDNDGTATNVALTNFAASKRAAFTLDIDPGSVADYNHVRYDDTTSISGVGFGSNTAFTALNVENTTGHDTLDGFEVFIREGPATVDFYFYTSFAGSSVSGLIHSETGFAATAGWNRFMLATPQSFPDGATRAMVLRINDTGTTFPAAVDGAGPFSGRSYISGSQTSGYSSLSNFGDLAQIVLLSSACSAPAISSQPSSQAACSGDNVTFSVTATGDSLGYQWRKNGVDIGGATSSSYMLSSVSGSDAATYTCVITNACDSVTSNGAVLSLNTDTSVDTNPSNQNVCSGDNASFTVTASGTSLTYQWRKGGVDIGGATSATYSITGVDAGDAGSYDCVVTGACGSQTSTAATLSLIADTAITNQPSGTTVCPGDDPTLMVVATGSNVTYQWRKGGVNIGGATSASYAIVDAEAGDAGSYDVVVAGDCGSVTSNAVNLVVDEAPAINSQPQAVTVCPGDNTSFSVTATGTGLTYQWRLGGVDIGGATSATYSITGADAGDVGSYDCVITGTCGSVTSNAVNLNLNEATAISAHPGSGSVCEGANTTLTITATGTSLSYQWRLNGINIGGANAASYSIVGAGSGDAGTYDCVVTGACSSLISNGASIAVDDLTAITGQPQASVVCAGDNTSFSVTATGTGLTYQWRKDSVDIGGATSATYSITGADTGDAANYDCVVTGACGSQTSNVASLTVNEATAISAQPNGAVLCEGDDTTLTVTANGTSLTYQWRLNGANISGATSASYAITGADAGDAGNYDCVVTGSCGTATSSVAAVTVNPTTAISTQPQAQTLCEGDTALFTVVATGSGLSYQWRKDGTNIAGQTASTLSIANLDANDAANYDCVIDGDCGNVTSNAVALQITDSVDITQQPGALVRCEGETAIFTVAATGASSFQWRLGGVNIAGATSATLTIDPVALADAGSYDCVVTGSCGTQASGSASLTVNQALAIANQPSGATVCLGDPIQLSVTASGDGLTYQWFKDAQALNGETGATLSIAGAVADDAGSYFCRLTGTCGTLDSQAAAVNVVEATQITDQPDAVQICAGASATFTVVAEGAGLGYQWRKDGADLPGETGASLVLDDVQAADAGAYTCVITGSCGDPITSATANLSLRPDTAIDTQPIGEVACIGDDVQFDVGASGEGLTYQWRKNGQDIVGATNTTLILNDVGNDDAATYTCVVDGDCGPAVTSSGASLLISPDTQITSQPADVSSCDGGTAQFTVAADGSALTYQWRLDGLDLPGETSASLVLQNLGSGDEGLYDCVVDGGCGPQVVSDSASLTLDGVFELRVAPGSTAQGLAPLTLTADVGCSVGVPTFEWYDHVSNTLVGTEAALVLDPVLTETAVFRIEVTDSGTSESLVGLVTVLVHPGSTDLNGDGFNNVEDLFLLLPDWRRESEFNATGDALIDVRDLMYINLGP